ncbi:MAG TPA: DUF2269 domain-containing protein [Noviherbaspirillum sp.]|nr:DUF2269 domain-containing protein [Noviherbaspirillum sp.]
MEYLTVKWLHILSSTILFGTGIGSAFYMLAATMTRDARAVAVTARHVVLADWLFTTPTIILQPLTGFYLMMLAGMPMSSRWIAWSLILYGIAVLCWLPVVWLQIRMRQSAAAAAEAGRPLDAQYWRLFRLWFALGWPAFLAFLGVFYLMVFKPA